MPMLLFNQAPVQMPQSSVQQYLGPGYLEAAFLQRRYNDFLQKSKIYILPVDWCSKGASGTEAWR